MSAAETLRPDDLIAMVAHLQRLVVTQTKHHLRLLDCIKRKREAIRRADIDQIMLICEEERAVADVIASKERERLDLAGAITAMLRPEAERPLTLREIAGTLADAPRDTLLTHAGELRDAVENVRRESSIVTAAADALSKHITGIMHKVNGALSSVGLYERRGRIAGGSAIERCIDVTS